MAIVIVSFKFSFSIFYLLLLLIISIVSQAKAQPNFLYNFCINDNGNYTANSTYQTNLNILLSNLSSNTEIDYGFYNFSYGQNSDKVNAIGLCRGDVKPDVCRNCLNESRVLLTRLCPNQKEAIGGYENCMLRYSNRPIFGIMQGSPTFYMWNTNSVTEVDQFNRVLGNLMKKLKEKAASSEDSRFKYATGNATDVNLNFQTIYGLVQCTPDLSLQDCNRCLDAAISEIPSCCKNKIGARVVKPSCIIRYESYLFYDPPPVVDPDEPSPPQASNILLDENMNAKISDFGMARLLVDQTQVNTDKVVGTYGYMAPEYAMFGQFSAKSDVFSFGVLVLEIISGQKISQLFHGQEDLLSFAWRNWREGTIKDIIDPSLNNASQNEIMRCIHIGLLCVQENLVDRPTMATIVLMLSSYSISLPVPLEPASFIGGRTRSLPGPDMQYGDDNSGAIRSNESKVIRKTISKQEFNV